MKTRTHGRELVQAASDRSQGLPAERLWVDDGNPLDGLVAVVDERARLAELELTYVAALRGVKTPWAVIGRALGITGQAASKRYSGALDGSS